MKQKGFSLIELLIVIAILGIMSTLGLVGYTAAQKRSRDTARQNALEQYRTALETFANSNNGLYPSYLPVTNPYSFCATLGFGTNCTQDSKEGTGSFGYRYRSDGSGGGGTTATKYVLYALLEAPTSTTYFVLCSTGSVLTKASAGVIGDCPN